MATDSEYEQRQFWEQPVLHPAIMHINCSPNLSNEAALLINQMVEKAYYTIKKPKKKQ